MSELAKAVQRALIPKRRQASRADTAPLYAVSRPAENALRATEPVARATTPEVAPATSSAEADLVGVQAAPNAHDLIEIRARMNGIEMLRGLSGELLDAMLARCSLHQLAAGETLLVAGQINEKMFVILSGEMRVHLDDRLESPIAVLLAGDTVGELSTIDHRPAGATVIANTDSLLLAIDESMFWHIVRASHVFAMRLMLKLAERLRANNSTVQANMELCAQLEAVAFCDALTGVHSRRWLDETLPRILDRHRFSRQPLSIAVIDVDHFKRINDSFGHPVGDIVLMEIAKALRSKLRPSDFVARFGGEEFVVILPNTALAGAAIAAERIREAVSSTLISTRHGATIGKVTVSIGVAELQENSEQSALLEAADAALYRAKRHGRDRVES